MTDEERIKLLTEALKPLARIAELIDGEFFYHGGSKWLRRDDDPILSVNQLHQQDGDLLMRHARTAREVLRSL